MASEVSKACGCLPNWMKELMADSAASHCCQCHEGFVTGTPMFCFSLVISCANVSGLIHGLTGVLMATALLPGMRYITQRMETDIAFVIGYLSRWMG